ncbi:unnamed protein product [Closterium sp. Naga37s-1]|nr:unnamed protein product [Closterium sp. Naga37s-1]
MGAEPDSQGESTLDESVHVSDAYGDDEESQYASVSKVGRPRRMVSQDRDPARETHYVLVVHGTFDSPPGPGNPPPWYFLDAKRADNFCHLIAKDLAATPLGFDAVWRQLPGARGGGGLWERCGERGGMEGCAGWGQLAGEVWGDGRSDVSDSHAGMRLREDVPYPFHWSGHNTHESRIDGKRAWGGVGERVRGGERSERARGEGGMSAPREMEGVRQGADNGQCAAQGGTVMLGPGKALAQLIHAVGRADPSARVHVVAHSHGGNVALKAVSKYISMLRRDSRDPARAAHDQITAAFWEAHAEGYRSIKEHQEVKVSAVWMLAFAPFLVVKRPWRGDEALGAFPYAYFQRVDSLLGLPKSVPPPCSTPTPAPHPPLLHTHPCSTPTPAAHPPLLHTHPCSTPTPAPHPPLLHTHPCCTPTPAAHPPLLHTLLTALCSPLSHTFLLRPPTPREHHTNPTTLYPTPFFSPSPRGRQAKYLRKKWAGSSSSNCLGRMVFLGTPFYTKHWDPQAALTTLTPHPVPLPFSLSRSLPARVRQAKYLRKKWAGSSSSNCLGRMVFLGTPFYTKHWDPQAALTMAGTILGLSVLVFVVIVGAVVSVKYAIFHEVNTAELTGGELTFWVTVALVSVAVVVYNTLSSKRYSDGNVYFTEKKAWSPAMSALVLNAGKLDEAALALSTEPLVRAYLMPQVKTMLTPDPWRMLRPFPAKTWLVSLANLYNNCWVALWTLVLAVPYVVLWLLNFFLVPYFCNQLLRLFITLGFGLQKNELDCAQVYVEEWLRLPPATHSIAHWNVQKILTAATLDQLKDLRKRSVIPGEVAATEEALMEAHTQLVDPHAIAQRWRFLWDDVELERKAEESTTLALLKNQVAFMAHNPRISRVAFERELKVVCVTLEERYKDMTGNVELSHGSYFRNHVVIAVIAHFLAHGEVPSWAPQLGEMTPPAHKPAKKGPMSRLFSRRITPTPDDLDTTPSQ